MDKIEIKLDKIPDKSLLRIINTIGIAIIKKCLLKIERRLEYLIPSAKKQWFYYERTLYEIAVKFILFFNVHNICTTCFPLHSHIVSKRHLFKLHSAKSLRTKLNKIILILLDFYQSEDMGKSCTEHENNSFILYEMISKLVKFYTIYCEIKRNVKKKKVKNPTTKLRSATFGGMDLPLLTSL
jgi:hypothetical protein